MGDGCRRPAGKVRGWPPAGPSANRPPAGGAWAGSPFPGSRSPSRGSSGFPPTVGPFPAGGRGGVDSPARPFTRCQGRLGSRSMPRASPCCTYLDDARTGTQRPDSRARPRIHPGCTPVVPPPQASASPSPLHRCVVWEIHYKPDRGKDCVKQTTISLFSVADGAMLFLDRSQDGYEPRAPRHGSPDAVPVPSERRAGAAWADPAAMRPALGPEPAWTPALPACSAPAAVPGGCGRPLCWRERPKRPDQGRAERPERMTSPWSPAAAAPGRRGKRSNRS